MTLRDKHISLLDLEQEEARSVHNGLKGETWYIRYNRHIVPEPVGIDFFSPSHWAESGCLVSQAQGRGNTYSFIYQQQHFFLRHYRRGGFFGPLLGDSYLWTGIAATRAWREFDLLSTMQKNELPVPSPIAAIVKRKNGLYRADIVTECIPNASTLAKLIMQGLVDEPIWKDIGCCIQRFHEHGIFHADLNAHNILIDHKQKIWLIDFDRSFQGRLSRRQKKSNLRRLLRSLHKVWPGGDTDQSISQPWNFLLMGYIDHDTPMHSPCP
jgi:3-deoxy-D-manno-octulosonic acid kinase